MVLADDDFSSIAAAEEEGRGVFGNPRKFIIWTLPTNMAEGLGNSPPAPRWRRPTVAVNVFVAAQIAYLFNSRSLEHLRPATAVRHSPWLITGIGVTAALPAHTH